MTDPFICKPIRELDAKGNLIRSGVEWGERGISVAYALFLQGRRPGKTNRMRRMTFSIENVTETPLGLHREEKLRTVPRFRPAMISSFETYGWQGSDLYGFDPYVVRILSRDGNLGVMTNEMFQHEAHKLTRQLSMALDALHEQAMIEMPTFT